MGYSHFERLSALDDSFLEIEDGRSHMHIGAVAVFEGGSLLAPNGAVDIDQVRRLMEAGLHRIPRYRQRLQRTPGFGQPVWVDDDRFNLAYHVRHTHLPLPGDDRQLKRLVGRVMSQELDRGKPLWEMWVVEGLEGGRFAIITKAHHCMIDGVGSVELTGSVMRPTPDPDPLLAEPAPRWIPRPVPSARELFVAEFCHRAGAPFLALAAMRRLMSAPNTTLQSARDTAMGVVEAVSAGLRPASPTPFNVEIGPHRRFDWTSTDLEGLKAIRTRYDGTVNDVVLAVLAGAIGRFLRRRGIASERLDFRAMVPVNARDDSTRHDLGNRVAMLVVRLPLAERDPLCRLERTIEETRRAKRSRQALGMLSIEGFSDRTLTTLLSEFARLTARARPYNLVVTNVPGPQFPVYIAGTRMAACYPLVPLFANQALGVALFSYNGRLYWGFNADWDAVPDLHDLVGAVDHELALLRSVGGEAPAEAAVVGE
jgi:WS/DGAT/MGAT family acyltransferase